ncbi:MAG: hypothetical protein KDC52_18710 [Ignavibacteriae bacterium]|nr:hypothetical protein [Ignavibacteriota bacterium]
MKLLTKNQFSFAIFFLVITIILHAGITLLLNAKEFTMVWFFVPVYVIPVFIAGWVLGKKDNQYLPLTVTGFKFHLITYVVSNSVALLKHLLGFASVYENIKTVYLTIIYWGIGLLIHFVLYMLARKKSIKGISKSELFE